LPTQPLRHIKHPSILLLSLQILQRVELAHGPASGVVEQMVPCFGKTPSRKYALIALWEQTEVAVSKQSWKRILSEDHSVFEIFFDQTKPNATYAQGTTTRVGNLARKEAAS
jgi:hypothetical protein